MRTSYLTNLLPLLPFVLSSPTSNLRKRAPVVDPNCSIPGSTWTGEMAYEITQLDPNTVYNIPFSLPCRINSEESCFSVAGEGDDGWEAPDQTGSSSGDRFIAMLQKAIAAGCDEGNSPGYAADGDWFYTFGLPIS